MRLLLIPLMSLIPMSLSAASNEETLEYIISDYQYQCEKAQEDFRDVDYEEGDPVVAELPVECFAKAGERTYEHDHQGFTC